MSVFPLINQLKAQPVKEYSSKKVCAKISTLSPQQFEIIQALIFSYYMSSGNIIDQNKIKIPYNGTVMPGGKGVLYTFDLLPKELQNIIAIYVL